MKEKYKLTQEEINQCVLSSPYALPNSPSEWGLGAGQIKKYFYQFIPLLAKSINEHLSAVGTDASELFERLAGIEEIVHDEAIPDIQEIATEVIKLCEHISDSSAHEDIRQQVNSISTVAQNAYNMALGKTKVYPTFAAPGVAIILRDNDLHPGDMIVLGEKNLPELMVYSVGEEPWADDVQFAFYDMYNYGVKLSPGKFYYFKDRKIKLLALEGGIDTSLLASREELERANAEVKEYVDSTVELAIENSMARGTYEKIAEFTTQEDAIEVLFSSLNLSSFYIEVIGGFVNSASKLYMNVNGESVCGNAGGGSSLSKGFYIAFSKEQDGICTIRVTEYTGGGAVPFSSQAGMTRYNILPPSHRYYKEVFPIREIKLYTLLPETGEKKWLKGSKFTLWGIRNNESV